MNWTHRVENGAQEQTRPLDPIRNHAAQFVPSVDADDAKTRNRLDDGAAGGEQSLAGRIDGPDDISRAQGIEHLVQEAQTPLGKSAMSELGVLPKRALHQLGCPARAKGIQRARRTCWETRPCNPSQTPTLRKIATR